MGDSVSKCCGNKEVDRKYNVDVDDNIDYSE